MNRAPGQPRVLNRRRVGNPPGSVYIGRGSKWGNPFAIGEDGDRETVIALFRQYIADNHRLRDELVELAGKDLVCYCHPAPCHGDVLLELANKTIAAENSIHSESEAPSA